MIVTSMLDTDLYKLSMQQAVCSFFPDVIVRYELIMRDFREFPAMFERALKREIEAMSDLSLEKKEHGFLLDTCRFLRLPYLDFLGGYRFDPGEVSVSQRGPDLRLAVEGYWYRTILWEVPLLATISELYFDIAGHSPAPRDELDDKIICKAKRLEELGVRFSDFGTRRRYSLEHHDRVVKLCGKFAPAGFAGTSNILLAMKHRQRAMGTQGHEWYMCIGTLRGYAAANATGMEKWVEMYRGDLGIALADTYTSDVFMHDFDLKFAKLFDGTRHDSGDPLAFAERMIRHYESLRIDPMSKTIVFSDNLDIGKVERIHRFCSGKVGDAYGIGTHLTNDVGVKPLDMVIKLTAVRTHRGWTPTVKLTDDAAKRTGPAEEIELCMRVLRIR